MEDIDLISPLSREECATRLRTGIGGQWSFGNPAMGSIEGWKLRIHRPGRNSLRLYLRATLEEEGEGTRLRCRIGRDASQILSSIVFLIFVIAFLFMKVAYGGQSVGAEPLIAIFAVAIVVGGYYWGNRDRDVLLDFMRTTVEAQEKPLPHAQEIEGVSF